MKTKQRGVKISCVSFRVVPDPIVDLWRQGKLHDSAVKVWVCMQKLAYEHKGEIGFNLIQRYSGVGRATLSRALRQLTDIGLIQRDGHVYTVVFDQPSSKTKPTSSKMELPSSKMEPPSSKMELPSSKMEPPSSKMEPQLSSNRSREIKRDLERDLERYRESHGESPTPRSTLGPRFSCDSEGGASANSSIHISEEDLAVLAHRYGIYFPSVPDSLAVRVAIHALLNGNDERKAFALTLLHCLAHANRQWR